MIEYSYRGGQLYAHVRRIPDEMMAGLITFVTWGASVIYFIPDRHHVPDDVQ